MAILHHGVYRRAEKALGWSLLVSLSERAQLLIPSPEWGDDCLLGDALEETDLSPHVDCAESFPVRRSLRRLACCSYAVVLPDQQPLLGDIDVVVQLPEIYMPAGWNNAVLDIRSLLVTIEFKTGEWVSRQRKWSRVVWAAGVYEGGPNRTSSAVLGLSRSRFRRKV